MRHRIAGIVCLAALACLRISGNAQTTVILRGKVIMADGSAPGKSVGTVRVCTDNLGTAPGPLTDKQGVFIWTMENNISNTRRCFIEATVAGYQSSQVEISGINPALGMNVDLKPIVLTLKGGDPYLLGGDEKDIPSKGRSEFRAAIKALEANDTSGDTAVPAMERSPSVPRTSTGKYVVRLAPGQADSAILSWPHGGFGLHMGQGVGERFEWRHLVSDGSGSDHQ